MDSLSHAQNTLNAGRKSGIYGTKEHHSDGAAEQVPLFTKFRHKLAVGLDREGRHSLCKLDTCWPIAPTHLEGHPGALSKLQYLKEWGGGHQNRNQYMCVPWKALGDHKAREALLS
jgi:hypothetical protein